MQSNGFSNAWGIQQTMASCLAGKKMNLSLWDMWIQMMLGLGWQGIDYRLCIYYGKWTYYLEVYDSIFGALSMIDAKYMVVEEATKEALWLTRRWCTTRWSSEVRESKCHLFGKEPSVSCKDQGYRCEVS